MKINYERIKYSPFGKRVSNQLKGSLLVAFSTTPLMLFMGLFFCAFSIPWGVVIMLGAFAIPAIITYSTVKSALLQARLLSDMTDEVHNRLVLEYKEYEERNIIRYGHLTSYGWVLDACILPWENINKIEIKPGEYRYVRTKRGGYLKYFPAKIIVTSLFDKKEVPTSYTVPNEEYDLSDEIERFLKSIPKYTEQKFDVANGYYFAK